jgi:hypothetical protein
MSNIYQQKYQKYKLKYLNLLNQSGGTKTFEEEKAMAIKMAKDEADKLKQKAESTHRHNIYQAQTTAQSSEGILESINFHNKDKERTIAKINADYEKKNK